MKFSDIFKKGYGIPSPSDLPEGGIGVDVQNKKAYSKGTDGTIFQFGLTDDEITALGNYVDEQISLAQPIGMISLWSGTIANIPDNWALCDGTNGTPNLLNRAIIAAGDEFDVGDQGDGSIPAHTHNATHSHTASSDTTGAHTHGYVKWKNQNSYDAGNVSPTAFETAQTESAGDHSHTITVDENVMDTGEFGVGTTVIPKHYALAYIMKIA